jgi:hypothetical protein
MPPTRTGMAAVTRLSEPGSTGLRGARRWGLSCAVYACISVLWTWPMALDPFGLDISLHMDAPGTLALGRGAALLPDELRSPLFNWPAGQSLVRGDSFVYFLLAALLRPLPAAAPLAFVALLGPILSALAAERLAERLGARAPWTLVAGITFGWSGVAATALLDGYPYALFVPWLPLAASAVLDATGPGLDEGSTAPAPRPHRIRDGLLGALWWFLCLATSAYVGITATLLVLVLVLGAWVRSAADRAPVVHGTAALFSGMCVLGGAYVAFFLSAPQDAVRLVPDVRTTTIMMAQGSARLGTLLWRSRSVDLAMHSSGALLGVTALVLACFAPLVVDRRRHGLRRLGIAAVLLTLIALGPMLRLYAAPTGPDFLLAPLASLGAGAFLRFPERVLLAVSLALAVIAAVVATRLADRRPRMTALLVCACAADVLIGASPALRGGHTPWAAPSAYAAAPADAAVLALWPRFSGTASRSELRLTRRNTAYAALTGRPTLSNALVVAFAGDNRTLACDWLSARALAAGGGASVPGDTRARLAALGIGAVAVHEQVYAPEQLDRLLAGITILLGPASARSVDAGDPVTLFVVTSDAEVSAGRPNVDGPSITDARVAALRAMSAEAPYQPAPVAPADAVNAEPAAPAVAEEPAAPYGSDSP